MKLNLLIISVWGLLSFLTFSYCNTNSNKVDTAAEDVHNAQNDADKTQRDLNDAQQNYLSEWEKFKEETQAEIKENENSIKTYRDMEKKDAGFSKRHKDHINELEIENSRLKQKLNDYNTDNMKNDWSDFKREVRHDMDELGHSLKDIGKDNVK
jgi:F0F1-type ATP synthase membrane subunit b/b'